MSFDIVPNANLCIVAKGLSIFYYNKTDKRREFLFLRHLKSHVLNVTIFRFGDVTRGEPARKVHEFKLDKEQDIFIEADKTIPFTPIKDDEEITQDFSYQIKDVEEVNEGDEEFRKARFNDTEDTRRFDIRWIHPLPGNIDGFPDSARGVQDEYRKENLTFLSLPQNGVIYTNKISEFEYDVWSRTVDSKNRILKSTKSKRIGNEVAVDFRCEGNINFKITGKLGFEVNLKLDQGVSYEIVFDNSCTEKMTEECLLRSDYQHNFDLFKFDPYHELVTVPHSAFKIDEISGAPIPVGLSNDDHDGIRSDASPPACGPVRTKYESGDISLLDWRNFLKK